MKDVSGDSSPSDATIKRHYANFRRGDFDLNGDSRSGSPAPAVTEENIRAVKQLVTDNRHITYAKIKETLSIHAASTIRKEVVAIYSDIIAEGMKDLDEKVSVFKQNSVHYELPGIRSGTGKNMQDYVLVGQCEYEYKRVLIVELVQCQIMKCVSFSILLSVLS
ncbi:hypothetical protein ILUMI_08293 [Ignelater luminosus]|uniref:Uncharacterized protein n=1 Tax=Ignelater luminosus TaxID=2038154 RepID=A0A8K0GDJ3_IGNLU|nr:hypothetical protein ILUMI_08293 [Ignelater luminosus]